MARNVEGILGNVSACTPAGCPWYHLLIMQDLGFVKAKNSVVKVDSSTSVLKGVSLLAHHKVRFGNIDG